MMDVDDFLPVNGLEGHQNGTHEQLSAAGGQGVVLEKVNGNLDLSTESAAVNGNSENEDDNEIINAGKFGEESDIRARVSARVNGLTISEDLGVEDADQPKHSKPRKGQGKSSKEKHLSPKHAGTTWVKKKKDGKDDIVTSASTNGSLAPNSRPKQTVKSGSFSDKQVHLSKSKNSEAASSTSNMIQPEGLVEKTRPKPVKLGTPTESDANTKSSSPTEGDAKARRVGTLPSYNFSFKCDERAEKRREFYTKLEEKTHAKEIERTNLQAKSKETQEAEIKMLRKSLNFKAKPMPSFYQEPTPPKAELKKIPPTRAKSPKLGRKKGSAPESEGSSSLSSRPGRLSLDEKAPHNNPAKGISPGHSKKPMRKSLPKLPSEKTDLSKSTNEAAFLSQEQEPVHVPDPSESQPDTDDKSEVEEEAQQTTFREPSALEN